MKILVWIEPIFIRESMLCYEWVATKFVQALDAAIKIDPWLKKDVRIFCNRATFHRVISQATACQKCLITTTDQEEVSLNKSLVPWAGEGMQRWISHMKGDAEYCDGYVRMLERVRNEFAFDAILAWETNGVVKGFAELNGVVPLFAENGPIRDPFLATGVIDSRGVNGDSRIAVGDIEWASKPECKDCQPRHEIFHSSRWNHTPSPFPDNPYVIVPLQTSDDANILVHNGGRSYEETIMDAVSTVTRTGLHCLVKTHPGAVHSPWNADAQARMTERLSSIPGVVLVDRPIQGRDYAKLLLDATGVATFNSSLGFEASLLGTPTHVMAPAGYAPPNSFATIDEIVDGSVDAESWQDRMAQLHFLMTDRYLVNLEDLFNFRTLHAVASFWNEVERPSRPSKNRNNHAPSLIPSFIKDIIARRNNSVFLKKKCIDAMPLGIRWPTAH